MQSGGLASYFQGETLQVLSRYLTEALNVCLERVFNPFPYRLPCLTGL